MGQCMSPHRRSTALPRNSLMTLRRGTHNLSRKPTGTLIFTAKYHEEQKKEKEEKKSEKHDSQFFDGNVFFGLNIKYEELEVMEKIGSGSYGFVCKARLRGKRIALKQIFISDVHAEKKEQLVDFMNEVAILSILRHPRIIHFLGAVQEDPRYCIITELLAGSVANLMRLFRRKEARVTWGILMQIAEDATEATMYLHNLEPQILHRDLKAENLLIDEDFRCKLTDFGLSRTFTKSGIMTVCGTPSWVAPEIFRGERYTAKIDIYSFGVVLWELFSFSKPYQDKETMELPYLVGKQGLRPPPLAHVPKALQDLMARCWEEDSTKRPDCQMIMEGLTATRAEIGDRGMDDAVIVGSRWGEQSTNIYSEDRTGVKRGAAATGGGGVGGDGGGGGKGKGKGKEKSPPRSHVMDIGEYNQKVVKVSQSPQTIHLVRRLEKDPGVALKAGRI